MIKVTVNKNIICVTGHANYDNYGSDIVCASVSSIIYTTVNGILNIEENAILFEDKNEMLKISVVDNDNTVKILIDNMLFLLKDVEKKYPKNIKITEEE